MTNEHKSTRLGDLLVERGVITRDQLLQAVELQQIRRHHAVQRNASDSYKQELGEVLIELGFINRGQLKSNLSWQRRIRTTTAVMVFIAPLLTAACGGGGGGGNTAANTPQAAAPSSLTSDASGGKTPTNPTAGNAGQASSAKSTVGAAPSGSSISSNSSAPSNSAEVSGSIQIYWTPPNQRENGEFLDITEVGGYELRYKRGTDTRYTSVIINDSYRDAYYFDNLEGDYEFQIAAFDTNGVYSSFVIVKPM